MAVDFDTLSLTFTPDGTDDELTTFTPGAGELWYADDFRVFLDAGTDSNTAYGAQVGFADARVGVNNSTIDATMYYTSQDTTGGAEVQSLRTTIGQHFSEDVTMHVYETDVGADATTIRVLIHLRRLL